MYRCMEKLGLVLRRPASANRGRRGACLLQAAPAGHRSGIERNSSQSRRWLEGTGLLKPGDNLFCSIGPLGRDRSAIKNPSPRAIDGGGGERFETCMSRAWSYIYFLRAL
jgi:hypothetical protein